MKHLINFFLHPFAYTQNNNNLQNFYKQSWIVYVFSATIFAILITFGYKQNGNCCEFLTFKPILLIINILKYILKIVFNSLTFSFVFIAILKLFHETISPFKMLFKVFFISYSIIIISYLTDILIFFSSKLFNISLLNPFKFTFANILGLSSDCSNPIIAFLGKIDILLVLFTIYAFVQLKNQFEIDGKKLLKLLIITVVFSLITKSFIPLFLT